MKLVYRMWLLSLQLSCVWKLSLYKEGNVEEALLSVEGAMSESTLRHFGTSHDSTDVKNVFIG